LLPNSGFDPGNDGLVAGLSDGIEGMAGLVDGFNPPDGRSNVGELGMAGFDTGRFKFGELTFGRLAGAGRLAPRFGTLG
jgi:hypothetical protein